MSRPPATLPIVHVTVEVAPCPHCGSTKHRGNGSHDQGDGSRLCYRLCKQCGGSFRRVTEFVIPDSGTIGDDPL